MITESRLQQECFLWHWNTYPEDRGALYLHYNNPKNAIHGAILKGMGLVEGVSDLGYLRPDGRVTYIEMKLPGKKQSLAQEKWQQVVESRGGRYFVCDNLEDFKRIIIKEMSAESPDEYLERLIREAAPQIEKIGNVEEWLKEIRGHE